VPKAPVVPGAAGAAVGTAGRFLQTLEIEELIADVAAVVEVVLPLLRAGSPAVALEMGGDSVQTVQAKGDAPGRPVGAKYA
jgi:hypothetical protein